MENSLLMLTKDHLKVTFRNVKWIEKSFAREKRKCPQRFQWSLAKAGECFEFQFHYETCGLADAVEQNEWSFCVDNWWEVFIYFIYKWFTEEMEVREVGNKFRSWIFDSSVKFFQRWFPEISDYERGGLSIVMNSSSSFRFLPGTCLSTRWTCVDV